MTEPHKEVKKEEEAPKTAKEMLEKLQEVLKNYGGQESNIPMNHEYWQLQGTYRAMLAAERDNPPAEKKEEKKQEKENASSGHGHR